ncbi:ADP-ribosylglycohydrolase family protein [Bacteroidota bacterium]
MKNTFIIFVLTVLVTCLYGCDSGKDVRRLSIKEYQSKMKAGWLGQMAGVGWGAPTEFDFCAKIIPEDQVPAWESHMINQQNQDDIYVEMTFLKTLEDYGFDVSIRQAGIDFANSQYKLWHANRYGRENLQNGIAPPYSGYPEYNEHADDIDYQIEADYSGLIAPGMPQVVIDLGEKFGRLMNYGDGLYGGQFVGAMYAEAFFERDINKIVEAGLACIPAESQYAEAVRDVTKWHKENPENWQKTWQLIENKYNLNPEYRRFSCSSDRGSDFNIDAKINGAYIVMGLLYGKGDMDQTIIISMRCGQDSDCNPSNAAGILATSLGLENLPEKYKTNIDNTTNFAFTAYNFPSLIAVCEKLTREAVVRSGGKIETNSEGLEELLIPGQIPVISPLEQCWDEIKIDGDVKFTPEEMEKIVVKIRKKGDLPGQN